MRPRFNVRLLSFEEVHAMPEAWTAPDYRAILAELDFDDAGSVAEDQARELCLMALTDVEPEEAAQAVLRHRLGARLRKGQIEDIAHGMVEEPLWEDYPDMRVHEELYNADQLLYDAYTASSRDPARFSRDRGDRPGRRRSVASRRAYRRLAGARARGGAG